PEQIPPRAAGRRLTAKLLAERLAQPFARRAAPQSEVRSRFPAAISRRESRVQTSALVCYSSCRGPSEARQGPGCFRTAGSTSSIASVGEVHRSSTFERFGPHQRGRGG